MHGFCFIVSLFYLENADLRMKTFMILCFTYILCTPSWVIAQHMEEGQASISFESPHHDFGRIAEDGGEAIHDFKFINTGKAPLVITDVEASCGCTSPLWSVDSIGPGEEGFVKVAYEPYNRPGPFNKTITVTTNGYPSISILTIEGRVVPPPKDITAQYPYAMGGLRFDRKSVYYGNITNDKPVTSIIKAYNGTDQIITFSDSILSPHYIGVVFEPKIINPGEVGEIYISYDGEKLNDLGYRTDNIKLFTYELGDSVKSFNVFATVLDYFPPLDAQALAQAPKISIDKDIEDFGNVQSNSTLQTTFMLTNEGRSPLELRKIMPNCNCVKVETESSVIQPGDSLAVSVTMETPAFTGTQQKMISVFTNDPTGHVKVLTLKAYVRE